MEMLDCFLSVEPDADDYDDFTAFIIMSQMRPSKKMAKLASGDDDVLDETETAAAENGGGGTAITLSELESNAGKSTEYADMGEKCVGDERILWDNSAQNYTKSISRHSSGNRQGNYTSRYHGEGAALAAEMKPPDATAGGGVNFEDTPQLHTSRCRGTTRTRSNSCATRVMRHHDERVLSGAPEDVSPRGFEKRCTGELRPLLHDYRKSTPHCRKEEMQHSANVIVLPRKSEERHAELGCRGTLRTRGDAYKKRVVRHHDERAVSDVQIIVSCGRGCGRGTIRTRDAAFARRVMRHHDERIPT